MDWTVKLQRKKKICRGMHWHSLISGESITVFCADTVSFLNTQPKDWAGNSNFPQGRDEDLPSSRCTVVWIWSSVVQKARKRAGIELSPLQINLLLKKEKKKWF